MITFYKILSYELRPTGQDVYDYLRALGRQEVDPSSLELGQLHPDAKIVYHSPLRRAIKCLAKDANYRLINDQRLREIPFDLDELCGRSAWEQEGSVAVRRGFVRSFIADTLPVSRQSLGEETRTFLEILDAHSQDEPVAVVSHSFRLKLIQAYLETGDQIEQEPDRLARFISPDKKTFAFGESFSKP